MSHNPAISVIMPVYNTVQYLREAIDSILNQTFTDFEFIIIDDASNDGSKEIIKSYTDERIILIENEVNQGIVYGLNHGISIARGAFIARMDSDDIASLNRLETQYKFLSENSDYILCSSSYQIMNSNTIFKPNLINNDIRYSLFFFNPIGHPTVMLNRKTMIENNLFYNENFLAAEDFLLWTELIHFGKIKILKKPLLIYRVHDQQISFLKSGLQTRLSFNIMLNHLFISLKEDKILTNYSSSDFYKSFNVTHEFEFLLNSLQILSNLLKNKNLDIHYVSAVKVYFEKVLYKIMNSSDYRTTSNILKILVYHPKVIITLLKYFTFNSSANKK